MKIFLSRAGGFGGLRLEGVIDTTDLPPELAARAEALLVPARLQAASEEPTAAGATGPAVDTLEYEISLPLEEGSRRFHLQETNRDQDLMDLVSDLLREAVRRKRGGR